MKRLNHRLTQIKMLFESSLIKKWIPPETLEKPWIHHLFRTTLTSLYQQERVIPSTSVAWKNLLSDKNFQRTQKRVLCKSRKGWNNSPLVTLENQMLLNFTTHLQTSDLSSKKASGATQWLTFWAIPDLFHWKDFSPQQAQPQSSTVSICRTNHGLTRVNQGQRQEEDLEVTQWKS